MAKQAEAHWRRFVQAIAHEAKEVGGFGSVTFEVAFSDGVPHKVDVLDRKPTYHLDHDPPSALTGAAARDIMPDKSG